MRKISSCGGEGFVPPAAIHSLDAGGSARFPKGAGDQCRVRSMQVGIAMVCRNLSGILPRSQSSFERDSARR